MENNINIPEFKIGDTYKDYDGYLNHIVNVFEHKGKKIYVMAYYGKHKQWWHYEIWSQYRIYQTYKNEPERFRINTKKL